MGYIRSKPWKPDKTLRWKETAIIYLENIEPGKRQSHLGISLLIQLLAHVVVSVDGEEGRDGVFPFVRGS